MKCCKDMTLWQAQNLIIRFFELKQRYRRHRFMGYAAIRYDTAKP